jgi:hypothetical protein
MKEKIDYQLLKNFSEGKYSFRDLKRITVWFEEPSYRNEIESAIHQHWNDFSLDKGEPQRDLSIIFDNLKEQIRLEQPQPVAISRRIVVAIAPLFCFHSRQPTEQRGGCLGRNIRTSGSQDSILPARWLERLAQQQYQIEIPFGFCAQPAY